MPVDDELESAPLYGADGWHTLESARYMWADAVQLDDLMLEDLLEVAKEQCLAYAPALPETALVAPTRYRVAQLMQARNLWNATKVDPNSGGFGPEAGPIMVFPMDWSVKNILRPKRGVPLVG